MRIVSCRTTSYKQRKLENVYKSYLNILHEQTRSHSDLARLTENNVFERETP